METKEWLCTKCNMITDWELDDKEDNAEIWCCTECNNSYYKQHLD